MTVGDRYLLNTITNVNGVSASNSYFYEETATSSLESPTDAAAAWQNTLSTAYRALFPPEVSLSVISQKKLEPLEGPAYVHQVGLVGTASGDAMPSNISVPLSFYALSGAVPPLRVRNGVSLAGISELLVSEGNINSLGLTLLEAFQVLLIGSITSTDAGVYKPLVRQQTLVGPPPVYLFFDMKKVLAKAIISSAARRVQSIFA